MDWSTEMSCGDRMESGPLSVYVNENVDRTWSTLVDKQWRVGFGASYKIQVHDMGAEFGAPNLFSNYTEIFLDDKHDLGRQNVLK